MKCPKCSDEIDRVDTFCPSCGQFLKEHKFERKREEHPSGNASFEPPQSAPERDIVACPKCGQKLSIPKQKMTLDITCPSCRTAFRHN